MLPAGSNVNQVFLYISVGYLLFGVVLLLIPELGLKARPKVLIDLWITIY